MTGFCVLLVYHFIILDYEFIHLIVNKIKVRITVNLNRNLDKINFKMTFYGRSHENRGSLVHSLKGQFVKIGI